MAFILQVKLSDVPGFPADSTSLLSFHYCETCVADGRMSFGWSDTENRGYDVSVLEAIRDSDTDGLGVVTPSRIEPLRVNLSEVDEIPWFPDLPDDVPSLAPAEAFIEDPTRREVYADCEHIQSSKIGGWPTWCQNAEWPTDHQEERMRFVGQVDAHLGENTAWGGGGYAYLFVSCAKDGDYEGELVVLTT